MNKKKLIIIITAILIAIIIIVLFGLKVFTKEDLPYVEEHDIEILSAKEPMQTKLEPYFKRDGNLIETEGLKIYDSTVTYKYYDYEVSEPDEDGYVIHKFKIDITIPIKYSRATDFAFSGKCTYLLMQPAIFDYYTGYLFREKNVSVDGHTNYYNVDKTDDYMIFTEVTWKEKTYKIGLRMESTAKWDGINSKDDGKGTTTVTDTNRSTLTVYISAPQDYDGLMLSLTNKKSTRASFVEILEKKQKYQELVKQAQESEEKAKELKELDDFNSKIFKLLDARTIGGKAPSKDEFYVIRVSEINKKESN